MASTDDEVASTVRSFQVWLARAGRTGEDEAVALELGLAIIGYHDIADLTGVSDSSAVLERVREASPGATVNKNRNQAAQLNAFVLRMGKGDIVALPLKTRPGRIALGRVAGPYRYQNIDGAMRHTRPVTWTAPDVPRSKFGQDLLYSLGAFLTVCRIERNDAQRRMAAILRGSQDPGSETSEKLSVAGGTDEVLESELQPTFDVAQTARDQILEHIRSRFPGHEFARLVEAVLQAEGYFTQPSSAGPDGGVDILAGRGSLGFEGPKLCVQVKATANPIDVTVLRSLVGTMQSFKADQGLLVSWGGFTRDLEREARHSFFSVRLWQADDLVNAICRNYDRLSKQIQNEIPLEGIWTLVRDDGEL